MPGLKNRYGFSLQTFADGDPEEGSQQTEEENDFTGLSSEEIAKKIESESDRKLAKAMEKKQAEFDDLLEQKLEEAKATAAEYAKMTEKEKQQREFEDRQKDLNDREKKLNNRLLLMEIESDLKENDLPKSLGETLVHLGDNQKIKEVIADIKSDFDEAVNEAVKKELRQSTPNTGGGISKGSAPSVVDIAKENRLIK